MKLFKKPLIVEKLEDGREYVSGEPEEVLAYMIKQHEKDIQILAKRRLEDANR